jgi:UDP-glucose 4-epimerase
VIGGSGFLGTRTVAELARQGLDVTSVSRGIPATPTNGVRYIDSTYDSISILRDIYLSASKIIHLAWDTTPMLSRGLPSLELDANLAPLARLLECLGENWSGELIFVSSGGAVYGSLDQQSSHSESAFDENTPLRPRSYYGAAKVAAEQMIYAFSRQTGTTTTILRPSNVYGPGQAKKSTFGVIPNLLWAIQQQSTFCIRGDGTEKRDYLFIDDFLSMMSLVANSSHQSAETGLLNVCSGVSSSINSLVEIAERVSGESLRLEFSPPSMSDPKVVAMSPELARNTLGWQASRTLEDGIAQTWQWMQERNAPAS